MESMKIKIVDIVLKKAKKHRQDANNSSEMYDPDMVIADALYDLAEEILNLKEKVE